MEEAVEMAVEFLEGEESFDSQAFTQPLENSAPKKRRVRKMSEAWTPEKTQRLVEAVEVREGTWNYLSPQYRDRNLKEALWQEVADILQMSRSEVSAKWNSLRCSFRAQFNRKQQTKSGQGAVRNVAVSPLYNALKFLEPTLQIEADTTSNLSKQSESQQSPTASQSDRNDSEDQDESMSTPSTSRSSVTRRRAQRDDDGFKDAMERVLETMSTAAKTDDCDELGSFVASHCRKWAAAKPQLAEDFKADLFELLLKYQRNFARPE